MLARRRHILARDGACDVHGGALAGRRKRSCPQTVNGTVNQYGIDYITINCAGDHTLHFSGSTGADLLPVNAYSGNYAFWSNKGDESDMTLTREFDFTNVSEPITLSYAMWYDLETDYDYLFLEASTDGKSWEILNTPSGTDQDPSGNSFGWGYSGQTNDWKLEDVDLSKFAGKKVSSIRCFDHGVESCSCTSGGCIFITPKYISTVVEFNDNRF